MKKVILIIGWILIGLAFFTAALAGLFAIQEGQGLPIAYSAAGRQSVFLPGMHLLIVLAAMIVGLIYVVRKLLQTFLQKKNRSAHMKKESQSIKKN